MRGAQYFAPSQSRPNQVTLLRDFSEVGMRDQYPGIDLPKSPLSSPEALLDDAAWKGK